MLTPDVLTNVLFRTIAAQLNVLQTVLDEGHQLSQQEYNDLYHLRERVNGILENCEVEDDEPENPIPRWQEGKEL